MLERYDVFLSYSRADEEAVSQIASKLKASDVNVFFDRWSLTQGGDWLTEIGDAIRRSDACAVFVGRDGIGPWSNEELKVAQTRVTSDGFFLFPVLLPGAPDKFDAGALPPFLSTRSWVDLREGTADPDLFRNLISAIHGLASGPPPFEVDDSEPPYQGLQAFDEEHADMFFGRGADVQRVLEKFKAADFLAVVGASGSGKSSLVRAGVVPKFRSKAVRNGNNRIVRVFRPGSSPLTEAASQIAYIHSPLAMGQLIDDMRNDPRALHHAITLALADTRGNSELLIVVDQFEELYTICQDDEERNRFIDNLLTASFEGSRTKVLVTMRADFYSQAASHPELAQRLASNQYLLGPMGRASLREVIESPARLAGLEFEPRLVDAILDDVADEPGSLPLLQHALLELWLRRSGPLLTLKGYRDAGGVVGALSTRADSIFSELNTEQQSIVRRIMVRLTQLGDETEDTRRRATLRELSTDFSSVDALNTVLENFASARLLTVGRDPRSEDRIVDVAHEALIRTWPRLREWLAEDRDSLILRQRIGAASREWLDNDRDEAYLYRGTQLSIVREWTGDHAELLSLDESAFISASVAFLESQQEAAAEAERQQVARRERDRVRVRAIVSLSAGIAIIAGLAILSTVLFFQARNQREIADSLALAAQADQLVVAQSDLSLLLAIEAFRTNVNTVTTSGLERVLAKAPGPIQFFPVGTDSIVDVAVDPVRGRIATIREDGRIELWSLTSSGVSIQPFATHPMGARAIAFDHEGNRLATAGGDSSIIVWDSSNGQQIRVLAGHGDIVTSVEFSPDGTTIASAGWDGQVISWDVGTGETNATMGDHTGVVTAVTFSPDGKTIASSGWDQSVIVWNPVLDTRTRLEGHSAVVNDVLFNPKSGLLASAGGDGEIRLWDVEGGTNDSLAGHESSVDGLAFDEGGDRLASVDVDGEVLLWNLLTLQIEDSFINPRDSASGQIASSAAVAFLPGAESIASVVEGGRPVVWDVVGRSALGTRIVKPDSLVQAGAADARGEFVAAIGADSKLRVWDTNTWESGPVLDLPGQVKSAALGGGNDLLALGTQEGSVLLFDMRRGVEVSRKDLASEVTAVAVASSNDFIAIATSDGVVTVWPHTMTSPIAMLEIGAATRALAFDQEGEILSAGGEDSVIRLWEWENSSRSEVALIGHTGSVDSLAFHPTEKVLASGSDDRTVRIWNLEKRIEISTLEAHTDRVLSVNFNEPGTRLVSGSEDSTVVLWDLASNSSIGEPIGLAAGFVRHVSFDHIETGRVTALSELGVFTVNASEQHWVETACRVALRNLTEQEWQRSPLSGTFRPTCELPS